jgi:hypothetical protein
MRIAWVGHRMGRNLRSVAALVVGFGFFALLAMVVVSRSSSGTCGRGRSWW